MAPKNKEVTKTATKTAPSKGGSKREQRAPNVKLPGGVDMMPLNEGLRPEGFLVVPSDETEAGFSTTFVGVLRKVSEKPDPKWPGKVQAWGLFEAVGDQSGHTFDKETGETKEITNGMLVGVSRKGALHGMVAAKEGHLFAIEYTGNKIPMGKGKNAMWEILCSVSREVYDAAQ